MGKKVYSGKPSIKAHKTSKLDAILMADYNKVVIPLLKKSNEAQLESIVSYMRKQANQRLRRLKESSYGSSSPAAQVLNKKTGHLEARSAWTRKTYYNKGKIDHNALVAEYSSLKRFLTSSTSTVSGYNEYRAKMAARIGSKKLFRNDFKTKRERAIWVNRETNFWEAYHQLLQKYGTVIEAVSSDQVLKQLEKVMEHHHYHKTKDAEIIDAMESWLDAVAQDLNDPYSNGAGIASIEDVFKHALEDDDLDSFNKKYGLAKAYE